MVDYFRVKNYERFQHYKGRRPPWIKVYLSTRADYHFHRLSTPSKLHLILIWLLAAEHDNCIPRDVEWLKVQLPTPETVDLDELEAAGFIEPFGKRKQVASKTLARCKQLASPERERERETEKKEGARDARATSKRGSSIDPFWQPDGAAMIFASDRRVDPARERDKFVAYHEAKGTIMKDWGAAWRTWILKAAEYSAAGSTRGPSSNGHAPPHDSDGVLRMKAAAIKSGSPAGRTLAQNESLMAELREKGLLD